MATFFTLKDPNAVLDYAIDWTNWLVGGDVISTSTWLAPSALTIINSTFTGGTTVVFLSGGTAGEVYNVTNRIITAANRTDDRTIEFTCIDR